MLRRRLVTTALFASACAASLRAHAQGRRPARVGWLALSPTIPAEAILARLRALGYEPGRDIELDIVDAAGDGARLPVLARELASRRPDVLVASANGAIRALKDATGTIPIVMAGVNSPVSSGLVASLARPGGNVTGSTYNQLEIAGKLVDVLKTAVPRASRIAVVWNPAAPGMADYKPFADRAAAQLNVELHYVGMERAGTFDPALVDRTRPDALFVVIDSVTRTAMQELVQFGRIRRIASIGTTPDFARTGGLLALAPDPAELAQNTAEYVDRLLRGTKPAELPVREPSRFLLAVNLRTARAIGLALPAPLMLQASEVIE